MEWTQFLILIATIAGLFFWNRSESRSDCRQTESILSAIKDEIKDFHGRLCALEEKYRQIERK